MLDPRQRQTLLESLRPPAGYRLSFGIITTFTLDLLALLTAPLAFTFFDWGAEDGGATSDPLKLLEAVRRHADRLAIFCQAGHISVPKDKQRLYTFLEDSVYEVTLPGKVLFHPKVWVLRYDAEDEPVKYRLLSLSRNLTFDSSWDTSLILDGELTGRTKAFARNHPLGDFIQALPDLLARGINDAVAGEIDRIQDEVRRVRFELPAHCDELSFWPIGIDASTPGWPFRDRIDRLAVVSPFLTQGTLTRLSKPERGDILISRLEELSRLNAETLGRFDRVYAMSPEAEPEDVEEENLDHEAGIVSEQAISRGLHAKIYIADCGWDARLWVGSANATDAAFNGNVEFLIELQGRKSKLGIDRFLGDSEDETTFRSLLEIFDPDAEYEQPDELQEALEQRLDDARRSLISARLRAHVTMHDSGDTCTVTVERDRRRAVELPDGVEATCWPILGREGSLGARVALDELPVLTFQELALETLGSFFAFEISVREKGRAAVRRFVMNLPLKGAPQDRRNHTMRALLKDKDAVMRFLLLLLSEDGPGLGGELLDGRGGVGAFRGRFFGGGATLFEALVKTLARDPERLVELHSFIEDLREGPEAEQLLPEGFETIWEPVWKAREALRE